MGEDQPKNANFQDGQASGLALPTPPPPETTLGKPDEVDRFILLPPCLWSPCPGT